MVHSRLLLVLFALVVSGNAVGCAEQGRRVGGATGQSSPRTSSPVVSPLTVRVQSQARLTTISSLRVLPLTVSPAVNASGMAIPGLQELLERRVDEALTMKVVPASSPAKADAVLKTEVLTYQEREGSKFGGEPAAVSFLMTISRVSDGAQVWQANYFFRQEALSDNWLKIGQRYGTDGTGSGWLSARELFDRGVSAASADFAARRDDQFVRPQK